MNRRFSFNKFRHRESESRVLVKLVDRGDEIIVDTSELLKLDKNFCKISAFAQPFRLYNYDESVSYNINLYILFVCCFFSFIKHITPTITRKLKRLILNQCVRITQYSSMIKNFHQVEVQLCDDRSVNQILLSNDYIPMV